MSNRQLSEDELNELFYPLYAKTTAKLLELSGGDAGLQWALRRKLYKELSYAERGKPSHRKRLKKLKRSEQQELCLECHEPLPESGAVLDRYEAMADTLKRTQGCCVLNVIVRCKHPEDMPDTEPAR